MKKYLLVLLVVSAILSACSSGASSGPTNSTVTSIVGTWKLTSYGPANSQIPAVANDRASVTFLADGTLNGNSGCNSIGGDYKVKGSQIIFGQIMSTMMGCEEPVMTQEGTVVRVMTETASFQIDNNMLTITKDDTVLVFEWVPAK